MQMIIQPLSKLGALTCEQVSKANVSPLLRSTADQQGNCCSTSSLVRCSQTAKLGIYLRMGDEPCQGSTKVITAVCVLMG